jgi:hypothetical protein
VTHRVVPLMYLLVDRGGVARGTRRSSSTVEGIVGFAYLNVVTQAKSCNYYLFSIDIYTMIRHQSP